MPKDKKWNVEEIEFKQKFIDRYSCLTCFADFKKYSLKFLRRAIRVNTLKISVKDLVKRLEDEWELTPVPWCKEGFWIEHKGEEKRRDIGNLREHLLGYVYIQEPASMIPPLALDPKPDEIVLDMCSAPGSKASQIAQYMENQGILICNDFKGTRMASLGINLQRVGASNTVSTMMFGQQFAKAGQTFDRILVDAPCSGTGTIRKSLKTIRMWNPNMIKRLAHTQNQLLDTAYKILKPGGILVYSTCSCEPEEDEGVVSIFLTAHPDMKTEKIDLKINRGKPILEFEGTTYHEGVKNTLRIWPQDNDTEGFFVCRMRKHNHSLTR